MVRHSEKHLIDYITWCMLFVVILGSSHSSDIKPSPTMGKYYFNLLKHLLIFFLRNHYFLFLKSERRCTSYVELSLPYYAILL